MILNSQIEYESFYSDKKLSEQEMKRICQEDKNPKVIEIFVKPDTPMYPKLSSGRKDKITLSQYLPGITAMDPQIPNESYKKLLEIESW